MACGEDAAFTMRLEVNNDKGIQVIGGSDKYMAVCRNCWHSNKKTGDFCDRTITSLEIQQYYKVFLVLSGSEFGIGKDASVDIDCNVINECAYVGDECADIDECDTVCEDPDDTNEICNKCPPGAICVNNVGSLTGTGEITEATFQETDSFISLSQTYQVQRIIGASTETDSDEGDGKFFFSTLID